MSTDPDLKRIQEIAQGLSEHFDSVQIFCTRYEGGENGGTINVDAGEGNWCARYGQIARWVNMQNFRDVREDQRRMEE